MILTDDERKRFAIYLDESAHASDLIISQMELGKFPQQLIEQERLFSTAAKVVAKRMRQYETQTIR